MLTALGLSAGVLTTGCWIPQVLRTLRTRHTDDLAWGYLVLFTAGIALWLAYGIGTGNPVIIVPNAVSLLLVALIVRQKVLNSRSVREKPVDNPVPAVRVG